MMSLQIDKINVFEISLESRACECCGGTDLESLWFSQSTVVRAKSTWKFPFNLAICRACGFCFASPGPRHDDLARYYSDGLTGYKEIGLPYSVEARISVLERYSVPNGVFAEIGGDQPGEFHRRCASLFGRQLVVDVASDTPAELRSVHDIAENSVDVLAHYDVLEHVTKLRDFLTACHRALKPDGFMVCEVPDLRLYPRNLLLLEFEHVNHFSAVTLTAIARSVGLNLVELGHICSRPYGLMGVFRKEVTQAVIDVDSQCEFISAMACVRGGLEQIRRYELQINSLRQQITAISQTGQKITLWAVTDLLRRLLDGFDLPGSVMVVDSDPRRKNHLESEGVLVSEPKNCIAHIAQSELLVICAPRYKAEILQWIVREVGKNFDSGTISVLGIGPSGESLT